MFETYRFEHLGTDQSREITSWSYVWAALVGPVYVLKHGFVLGALAMLVVTMAIAVSVAATMTAAVGLFDSPVTNVLSSLGIPLLALVLQGWSAVQIVRRFYVRRGWREGY